MMDNQTNKSSSTSKDTTSCTGSLNWYWILECIICVFIITGNAITIIVVTRRRLRNVIPNQFIVSLAVADFLLGAVRIIPIIFNCISHDLHSLTYFIDLNVLIAFSIFNLCVMTLDRFLAVVFPYVYQTFMTQRKAWLLMSLAWVIPISVCSVFLIALIYTESSVKASLILNILVILQILVVEITPCVLMIISHTWICLIVRKHSRQIACQNASQRVNNQTQSAQAKNERSTVKVFTLVVVLFILCYILSVYTRICAFFKLCSPSLLITQVSNLLYFLNSAINPFVYAFLKRDIRRELKRILRTCLRCFGVDVQLVDEF